MAYDALLEVAILVERLDIRVDHIYQIVKLIKMMLAISIVLVLVYIMDDVHLEVVNSMVKHDYHNGDEVLEIVQTGAIDMDFVLLNLIEN